MKKGFRVGQSIFATKAEFLASSEVSVQEKDLYRSVADADWHELKDGMGRQLSQIFVETEFRPNQNDPSLRDEADKQELLGLVKAIYERL